MGGPSGRCDLGRRGLHHSSDCCARPRAEAVVASVGCRGGSLNDAGSGLSMATDSITLDSIVTASVAGRVAIVTGAGRVFVKAFARAGAIPVIADKNAVRGNSVANEVYAAGGRAF